MARSRVRPSFSHGRGWPEPECHADLGLGTPVPDVGRADGRLVDELYPEQSTKRSTRENALAQVRSTSGALRLAEEYQAALGRDALDRLIIAAVPDTAYEPSPLHSLLLRLPWSDVFTTNYDTLLERAAKELVDRKYDVVRTAAEIPDSARPRIIKLHGSFPSNRPFIITEEDFRTYPNQFAPLVNLTQQAMMEGACCLLGFSGDDPNFLHWSGWVRDNLGMSSPVIYLCGLLDLNSPRRKLLNDRNVVPIDLSPLFPPTSRTATPRLWSGSSGRWTRAGGCHPHASGPTAGDAISIRDPDPRGCRRSPDRLLKGTPTRSCTPGIRRSQSTRTWRPSCWRHGG